MKVKTTNNNTFNPITLEITIESEDELKNLWAALNIIDEDSHEEAESNFKSYRRDSSTLNNFWREVNEHCKRLGLKKEEI